MLIHLSYGLQHKMKKKGHYLVRGGVGVAALMVTAVVMVMVVTAAFKTVVGAVMLVDWDLIDRLDVVGVMVGEVGDVVVSLIVDFFIWQQCEQHMDGAPSLVGDARSFWSINLKHHDFLKPPGR